MLWVASLGLIVNLIVFSILLGADQENLNIRGAVLHVIGDLLGSVAAIAAGVIILTTGWVLADPILSVLVALLILRSAWSLVKDSAHVLLQGAPKGADFGQIERDLKEHVEGLTRAENIRIWSLTRERTVMTLTAHIDTSVEIGGVSRAIKSRLSEKFHIEEVTVEVRRKI
jgi:cobalt-zinc-cadmium efflux system protein